MTLIGRSIVESSGYIGGPGINVIHWTAGLGPGPADPDGVEEWHDSLVAVLQNFVLFVPTGIALVIQPEVVYFNDDDGVLLGSTTDPVGARFLPGSNADVNNSRATQLTCVYKTEEFINGRRLQGRSFIGPISAAAIGSDGQVITAITDDAADYFTAVVSGLGGRLAVWHRPTEAAPSSGAYGDVTSVRINSTPGTLRSRKT